MAAALKKFFEKRRTAAKFKRAGEGHRLNEPETPRVAPQPKTERLPPRQGPTSEQVQAATAAMARLNAPSKPAASRRDPLRDQIRREMELASAELASSEGDTGSPEVVLDGPRMLAPSDIRFVCPMVGPEALPKQEMEAHIESYLLGQLAEEPVMAGALIIQTLNKAPSKVKVCVDVLCKYLDNIIDNPQEEKFQRIRASNKTFQEKVVSMRGSEEYLQAIGFTVKTVPGPDGEEDAYFVLDAQHAADTAQMKSYKEILLLAEPIIPRLDRSVKVFHPSPKANQIDVPPEFYAISPDELKKEQQVRREAVEKLGMLRTKEMKERDRLRELRRYRFAIIRVRFPDGVILQGTFRATEPLSRVLEFVRESLDTDWIPFSLTSQTRQVLDQDSMTITELDLAPASIINFTYDPAVLREVASQSGSFKINNYLSPELLSQIESL